MNMWLLLSSLLLSGGNMAAHWTSGLPLTLPSDGEDAAKLSRAMGCRSESSPLVRLECYDRALAPAEQEKDQTATAGPAWQRAMNQEKARSDHSTNFLTSDSGGSNPLVVITTPALGVPPPRPVLMLSCIDNITRLQVALNDPQTEGEVELTLDNIREDSQWFVRENGFLLESSRGLAGIEEIKRLMSAETFTIAGKNGAFTRLTFNISDLPQTLKPLRQACHW
ncbi:type VI secretion system-associated protein VasI [Erwiniaceae bacterium CAU 1747]